MKCETLVSVYILSSRSRLVTVKAQLCNNDSDDDDDGKRKNKKRT